MRRYNITLYLLCLHFLGAAQDTISLEMAIETALRSNYNILLVSNEAESASLRNSAGFAGALPSVNAVVTDQFSANNIYQRFANGEEITSANASGNNLSAYISLDWTLFNGFRIDASRDRLRELDAQGQLLLKRQAIATVEEVTIAYMEMVRLEKQIDNARIIIGYNEERSDLARLSFEAGLAPKTNWLQAAVDLNNQKLQIILLETRLEDARNNLAVIVGSEATPFNVRKKVDRRNIDISEIQAVVVSSNHDLLVAQSNNRIAGSLARESAALLYPEVTLNAAYNFSRSDNSAGFSLLNRTYGPTAGFTIIMPLFNGGVLRKQKQIAGLQLKSSEITVTQTRVRIDRELQTAIFTYLRLLEMFSLQENNKDLARENLDIATERLRVGMSNALEAREAQLSYESVLTELSNLEYELKVAETRMLALAGKL